MKPRVALNPGDRFGRLLIEAEASRNERGRKMWACRCDCGSTAQVLDYVLKQGSTQSCGCMRREMSADRLLEHGGARRGKLTPEFRSWNMARNRVSNPKSPDYPNYGGRGITMAPEFFGSFDAFLAYMGPRPSPKHSIDRIDNDRGYEPGNMRWATSTQQNRNRAYVKLNEEIAAAIRASGEPARVLAAVYGVGKSTIKRVRRGETWT